MLPRVLQAKASRGYQVEVTFDNHETEMFDVNPYLELGLFKQLKDPAYFSSVTVEDGTIVWKNGQDFSPDTLYLEGELIASADAALPAATENPPGYKS